MMLEALGGRSGRKAKSRAKTFLAPTKGWYALENIAAAKPGTATVLENFFPRSETVDLRAGWAEHSDTGETTPVDSLMPYHGPSGVDMLFGATGDTIFDVTSSSGAASTITSLTNARLESVNFSTSGGHYLYCVNGADTAKAFDGSVWSTPAITGVTSDTFTNVNVFKRRLFFAIKDSLSFAYLPVDSIAGAATSFAMGSIFPLGGHLVAIGTWTFDGGSGPDDHIVFLTSKGQVAIYQGSDPSDANQWSHVGTYDLPIPVGKRCMLKVGGDIYIITAEGVLPLAKSLVLDKAAVSNFAMTRNIAPVMNTSARRYGDNFGWQLIAYPKGTMAILNVPLDEGTQQQQYVMNTITGAWCKFTNQNANCWTVFRDRLFFGGNDGKVYEADSAASDGGAEIVGSMRLSDDSFGSQASLKHWHMIRVNLYADGRATPLIGMNTDYENVAPTGVVQSATSDVVLWDEFDWDEADWPAERTLFNAWQVLSERPGYAGAIHMKVSAQGTGSPILLQINGFDVTYEQGGIL